jgi:hypothetical protein
MSDLSGKQREDHDQTDVAQPAEEAERFPELEELRRQVERRIRDNDRFLARMFDDDFEDDEEQGTDEEEAFEEL